MSSITPPTSPDERAPTPKASKAGLREFLIDNAVVAGAQLLTKLRGVLTLPLIVQSLGTASYGIWSQVLAFVGFAAAIVGWNLHLPLIRTIAADRERAAQAYGTVTCATLALGLGSGALMLPFTGRIGRLLLGEAGLDAYLAAGLALVVFGNLRVVASSVYRATGRFIIRSAVELFGALIELAGILAVLYAHGTLGAALVFMVVWNGILAIGTAIHAATIVGWARPDLRVFTQALRYTTPLLPAAVSIWLLDRGDRFVIGHYLGAGSVGVYSACYAVGALLLSLQAPLQLTLFPKVSQLWDCDRAAARKYVLLSNKFFLTLAIPCVAAMPFVAPTLLARLGNQEIAAASGPLTLLIAAGATLWGVTVMQTQPFYAAKNTRPIGAISICAALVNLALNFVLVPRIGIVGSAAATLLSYACACIAFAVAGRQQMHFDFYPVHLLKCVVSAAAAAGLIAALAPRSMTWLVPTVALAGAAYFAVLALLRAFTAEETAVLHAVAARVRGRGKA